MPFINCIISMFLKKVLFIWSAAQERFLLGLLSFGKQLEQRVSLSKYRFSKELYLRYNQSCASGPVSYMPANMVNPDNQIIKAYYIHLDVPI